MPPHTPGGDLGELARHLRGWLAQRLRGRPGWLDALYLFCCWMAFVYVPWDLFVKPVARDEEVWFGIIFSGWAAKLGGVAHWFVYAAGAYGLRRMSAFLWPWAAIYSAQVALSMWVWNGRYPEHGGVGWFFGLFAALPFAWLALVLWRSGSLFGAPRPPLRERYGEWALVTGASAGIGAAFARELARDGMSVVLSARREDRLRALAAELERAHAVRTRVIASDLATNAGQDELLAGVADLDLALAVLNAGIGQQGRFEKCDPQRLEQMLALNCAAPLRISRALAPRLAARGRAALLFTGSVAGRQPLPLHAAYAASKAWILLFGEALAVELGERGVDVLVVEPGVTETEFQELAGELPHAGARPEQVVRDALDALGIQSSVVPGWYDWLRANVAARLLPRSLAAAVGRGIMERQTPPEMR
jgi:hypothetical protein